MGCGKNTAKEDVLPEDAAGDAVVIEEESRNEVPKATEEMNMENESAQVIEPEPPQEEMVVDPEQLHEPEIEQKEVAEPIPEQPAVNRMQIVFLGDSILDGYRDESGIAYLTGVYCDADVFLLDHTGAPRRIFRENIFFCRVFPASHQQYRRQNKNRRYF